MDDNFEDLVASAQIAAFCTGQRAQDLLKTEEVEVTGEEHEGEEDWHNLLGHVHD